MASPPSTLAEELFWTLHSHSTYREDPTVPLNRGGIDILICFQKDARTELYEYLQHYAFVWFPARLSERALSAASLARSHGSRRQSGECI
jgi:hypothetical protein